MKQHFSILYTVLCMIILAVKLFGILNVHNWFASNPTGYSFFIRYQLRLDNQNICSTTKTSDWSDLEKGIYSLRINIYKLTQYYAKQARNKAMLVMFCVGKKFHPTQTSLRCEVCHLMSFCCCCCFFKSAKCFIELGAQQLRFCDIDWKVQRSSLSITKLPLLSFCTSVLILKCSRGCTTSNPVSWPQVV